MSMFVDEPVLLTILRGKVAVLYFVRDWMFWTLISEANRLKHNEKKKHEKHMFCEWF